MKPPLFIVSPPRSFTTVTCAMLGNHPEMYGLAETNLFMAETLSQLQFLHRAMPRFGHGLLRSIAELGLGDQSSKDIEAARAWLNQRASMITGEIFLTLAEWAAPRRVIDKSPLFVYSRPALDRIVEAFPDARFLHLTRHPVDTCKSVIRMRDMVVARRAAVERMMGAKTDDKSDDDKFNPDRIWLDPHLTILEFLDTVPKKQHMRVQGEKLLREPRSQLGRIAQWLGIDTEYPAIEAMLHPEESPFARYGPANARFGNDPLFMENPKLRRYNRKLVPVMASAGSGDGMALSETLIDCARMFGY